MDLQEIMCITFLSIFKLTYLTNSIKIICLVCNIIEEMEKKEYYK